MTAILAWLAKDPIRAALLAAVLFVSAALAWNVVSLWQAEADLTAERADRDREKAAAAGAALKQVEAFRKREAELVARAESAEGKADEEKKRNAELAGRVALLAPIAASVPGLRNDLERARRAAGGPAADPVATCEARAGAYESVLAEGDRVVERLERSLASCRGLAGEAARAHDDRAAEVGALLDAWP